MAGRYRSLFRTGGFRAGASLNSKSNNAEPESLFRARHSRERTGLEELAHELFGVVIECSAGLGRLRDSRFDPALLQESSDFTSYEGSGRYEGLGRKLEDS
jgi:hypothetical protein